MKYYKMINMKILIEINININHLEKSDSQMNKTEKYLRCFS